MKKYYITSAIPYVNAVPHIGWASEIIQSDVLARYYKAMGHEVFLLCGSDENSLKNVNAAQEQQMAVQAFVDQHAFVFEEVAKALGVSIDVFQKGSSETHHTASQLLWKKCFDNGDIYKKTYTGLYCVGCELFYTKEELNPQGECFEHPGKKVEEVQEENYFFRLSKYQEKLRTLLFSDDYRIIPDHRRAEMIAFIEKGLEDFSISRSNERAKNWGVMVPGDSTQRMYVWFDALNIYQSGIGFGWDETLYQKWWPADLHVIGKGIIRFHAIYWPAILLSAGLSLPKQVFVHEYLTVDGKKIAKSTGTAIDPRPLIATYQADGLRYYLLSKFSPFVDGDFSQEKCTSVYNADLANGLGNLLSRVAKLCEQSSFTQMVPQSKTQLHEMDIEAYHEAMKAFRFHDALSVVWSKIARVDQYIDQEKPWELAKQNSSRLRDVLAHAVDQIQEIGVLLTPFLPHTASVIQEQFGSNTIVSQSPLFPRIMGS